MAATTAATLITDAQTILSDPSGDRWTNAELLVYMAEGINEFFRQTKLLRNTISIPNYLPTAETTASSESLVITVPNGTNTNTITVTGGALPTTAIQVNVYLTAANGAAGTEIFAAAYTSGTSLVITAASAGGALPTANGTPFDPPTTAPTLTTATTGGSLVPGTYYAKITYTFPSGTVMFSTDPLINKTDIYEIIQAEWDVYVLHASNISEFRNGHFTVIANYQWERVTGFAVAYTQETLGTTGMRLFPTPTAAVTFLLTYIQVPDAITVTSAVINIPNAWIRAPMYWTLMKAFSKEPDAFQEVPAQNIQAKFYYSEFQRLVADCQRHVSWGHNNAQFRVPPRLF